MNESTSVLTHSRPVSVTKAMNACLVVCELSDVQYAFACIATLLARPRSDDEDDTDTCAGLAVLFRFVAEAMSRHVGLSLAALRTLSHAIERERAEAGGLSLGPVPPAQPSPGGGGSKKASS